MRARSFVVGCLFLPLCRGAVNPSVASLRFRSTSSEGFAYCFGRACKLLLESFESSSSSSSSPSAEFWCSRPMRNWSRDSRSCTLAFADKAGEAVRVPMEYCVWGEGVTPHVQLDVLLSVDLPAAPDFLDSHSGLPFLCLGLRCNDLKAFLGPGVVEDVPARVAVEVGGEDDEREGEREERDPVGDIGERALVGRFGLMWVESLVSTRLDETGKQGSFCWGKLCVNTLAGVSDFTCFQGEGWGEDRPPAAFVDLWSGKEGAPLCVSPATSLEKLKTEGRNVAIRLALSNHNAPSGFDGVPLADRALCLGKRCGELERAGKLPRSFQVSHRCFPTGTSEHSAAFCSLFEGKALLGISKA
uniref:Pherophorin domain-containing protein n=1 Tax=Chromera velia CCMP2878 TaxID=1169474 RepID=A0A0G4FNP4_9ALVE|eukprot:Cvel_17920.t1-p1 / transcript=Cvel_17920.t1 / gene=Cvel_17920 / organism=Chromera_velia_CCMP2878 / gene_product=hypothetical protein / transcript_product=hypothetical protein / location=Cvel_scaffold1455:43511-46133(-) / protein_length=357 / sequence_SO=supercontig / SO=protein_coding / is_pseudo=false